jgi:hypothetical protein
VDVNWDQLINILWLLIVFIAPAVIGIFKKKKNEETAYDDDEQETVEIDSILGGREIQYDKLKARSIAKPNVEKSVQLEPKDNAQVFSPQKNQKAKSYKSEGVVRSSNDFKVERKLSARKSNSVTLSKTSKVSTNNENKFDRNPKNIRKLLIWKEILGPPKALDPNPW